MGSLEQAVNDLGQTVVRLKHGSGALCEVFLFGATVTKFVTASGRDVIWCSGKAKLDGTKAIRGGVPLVFPQFGTPLKDMAQHGFARNNQWTLKEGAKPAEGSTDVLAVLTLDNTVATHDVWKHPYRLEYTVSLGAEMLTCTLSVFNEGDAPFEFMDLLHTYLNIGDISKTTVTGLEGTQYLDKTSDDPEKVREDDRKVAVFAEFTDRVYVSSGAKPLPDSVVVNSPLGNILVTKMATETAGTSTKDLAADVVLWNPWAEKASSMADFEEGGHQRMLCVEPGLVSGFHTLAPKASVQLTQVLATPRKYCLGGNWKSNPAQLSKALELCETFKSCKFDTSKVEAVICCTAVHGAAVMDALKGSSIEVGIQNISKTGPGAFTGEVTAEMAADAGYKWCLIGHSERRTLYGETVDDTVAKLKAAQAAGLKIMFCIGETLAERESGITDAVNQIQLAKALPEVTDWDKFVIAYEPVWAIGTGKVATPEQAQETQMNIRRYIGSKMGACIAAKVRIQYGGSASPSNIEGLAVKPDIDGFLVGGASLKPDFTKMMEHLSA